MVRKYIYTKPAMCMGAFTETSIIETPHFITLAVF